MRLRTSSSTMWTVVVVALIALLPLLAVLQYRWIGQVSQAERERMQANVRNATRQFAQEFNQELTRAWVVFQTDPGGLDEASAQRFTERYNHWTQAAPYPSLIRKVYAMEIKDSGGVRLLELDAGAGRLQPVEWPAAYVELHRYLETIARDRREWGPGARPAGWTIVEEIPAIVAPIFRLPPRPALPGPGFGPPGGWNREGRAAPPGSRNREGLSPQPEGRLGAPRGQGRQGRLGPPEGRILPRPLLVGCTVLELNLQFLQNELLPELTRKHFGSPSGLAYQVAVVKRSEPDRVIYRSDAKSSTDLVSSPDAAIGILSLNPEDVARFWIERTPRPPFGGWRGGPTFGFPGGAVPPGGAPARDTGRWQLLVKHRSGSLETAVAQARMRNMGISFGILLLLTVSVAMIIVSTRRAQRLASLQMEFVAGVSHELRTPLAVICSAADNLAEGVVAAPEQTRQYGSLIRGEGRRLSEMVGQILAFAKAQSDRKKYELRPVGVEGIIETTLVAASPTIREAGVEVTTRIEPGLPPVMADAASLANCIQNLLSNALKYGKDGGQVRIHAALAGGERGAEVEVSVEDKGPGIDPADLPHIFEPFYRGADAAGAQIHGTGLGLSLVKHAMEAQGGRVSVQSTPGEGATFTLHLPAVEREVPSPAAVAT